MNEKDLFMNPEFSIRIVVCDHYLTKPVPGIDVIYSEFRGTDIKQVPVLRIFGATPEGRKACLHVHGVFPYFYIPCSTPNPEPQYLYQIAASLDKALNIALKQATSANQHVYKITLVKGLPFYGFHNKEHLYLKVFLYTPGLIKQAVELCSNGAILGQPFQPHESHLNFTLQFFIDFNLFGMSNIDLHTVKYRKTGLTQNSNDPFNGDELRIKPESSCFFEVDCIASHILNRQRIGKGDGIENPGLEEVWNQEDERRKQLNASLAMKSLSQGRINDETDSHYKFQQMIKIKMSNDIEKPVIIEDNAKKVTEAVYYPAESLEGSQLFNAVDISVHLPNNTNFDTSRRYSDDTLVDDIDTTIVDEDLALNCSLHYSQVLLNTEDLDLVDMLKDMDEKDFEDDSVMGTPANADEDELDIDDAEYSKIYDEDTICMNSNESKDQTIDDSPVWNDSFWDGATIPQLDGTFDDEHVKKVRKRKMRPLQLGLSRPKSKKKVKKKSEDNIESENVDASQIDEINVSRDTIEDISSNHLRRAVITNVNVVENNLDVPNKVDNESENISIVDLVNRVTENNEFKGHGLNVADAYDAQNEFVPVAGPSLINNNISVNLPDTDIESTPEDKSGFMTFYASKMFDSSLEDESEKNYDNQVVDKNYENLDKNIEHLNESQINICNKTIKIITPKIKPPTKDYIENTLEQYNIPRFKGTVPYYSDYKDVGDKVEIGQMLLKLQSKAARDQKPFEKVLNTTSLEEWRQLIFLQNNKLSQESSKPEALKSLLAGNRNCVLEPINKPPTRKEVEEWLRNNNKIVEKHEIDNVSENIEDLDNSQALGLHYDVTESSISLESEDKEKSSVDNSMQITMQPDGSFLCFGGSNQKESSMIDSPTVEVNFLTLMLIEVHTSVRGDLNPDPTLDPIQAIFINITNDCPPNHFLTKSSTEILVIDNNPPPKYLDRCVFDYKINYVNNEIEIIEKVIELVKVNDPDIICGYEIEMASWGYILERSVILGVDMITEISRITEKNRQKRVRDDNDFEGRVIGRIMFNVWRLFRHELALSSYSFENCMFEVLKERVPKYSYAELSEWWNDDSRIRRWIPVEYYITKLKGTVRMLEKLDIINRTSELARLFGLQWWEVLSRGSQFRVESLMLRAARPLNLIALSPTVKQRAAMKAPECLPLIFEPESRFYKDPMIVLDFQSLYPSMMIAYNYCFSTCIGRIQNISGDTAYEFGAWRLRISKSKLEALINKGLVHWSPVGVGFVKSSVRRGVLPALLRRILAARQAVKKNMKLQTDEGVKKAMHSRQLGLKLIANVTYGYTAANFSGRMPCVEVADSVVAKGRETLERAIKLVQNNTTWKVKVVYGDTDSMFVLVPGRSRDDAFKIGQEIADAVTADNPSPVALKLEKVYQPCILQTKKRYVGYMYESPDQEKPVYEAKGIETVRRDGCPAGVKLLQRALCELFTHGDMSIVKRQVCEQLSKLVAGDMPIHELFFTREYHGPRGYRPGATAPPNEIAKRMSSRDPRALPRTGWRVSWAVTAGAPGEALCRLARSPAELARSPTPPHVMYYVARVLLPPLQRCLSLLGADVFKWWRELGYTREAGVRAVTGREGGAGVGGVTAGIARYLSRGRCAVCGARAFRALCADCGARESIAAATLASKGNVANTHLVHCYQICASCCGHDFYTKCENTECPALWRRLTAKQKLGQIQEVVSNLPNQFNREIFEF